MDYRDETLWPLTEVPESKPGSGPELRAWRETRRKRESELRVLEALERLNPGLIRGARRLKISEQELLGWFEREVLGDRRQDMDESSSEEGAQVASVGIKEAHALRFLLQGLRRGVDAYDWKIDLPRSLRIVEMPGAVLDPMVMRRRQPFKKMLQRFWMSLETVQKLKHAGSDDATAMLEERLGQVVFSAVAFGGLIGDRFVRRWMAEFALGPYDESGFVWYELGTNLLPRRWFPDVMTEILIRRWWFDGLDKIAARARWDPIEQWERALARVLEPAEAKHRSGRAVISAFFDACSHELSLRLSPILFRYATGEQANASLPQAAFLRLITGCIVRESDDVPTDDVAIENIDEIYGVGRKRVEVPLDLGIALKELQQTVTWKRRGSKLLDDERLAPEDYKRYRTHVLDAMKKLSHERASRWPDFVRQLASWCIAMLTTGTILKEKPSPATIQTYFAYVATSLREVAHGGDLTRMPAAKVEQLFREIVQKQIWNGREVKPAALTHFWEHLVHSDQWQAQPIAWDEIFEGSLPTAFVDADVLTPDEYQRSLDLIAVAYGKSGGARDGTALQAALVIFFRFGLRRGELAELPLNGLFLGSEPEIWIESTTYGPTKTPAGRRTARPNGRLSEPEREILQSWRTFRSRELGANASGREPLFGYDKVELATATDRIVSGVVAAIRAVTTIPTLHLHHLRHGYVTFRALQQKQQAIARFPAVNGLFATEEELSPVSTLTENQRRTPYSRAQAWDVSLATGHSLPGSTLASYDHSLDFVLRRSLVEVDFGWLDRGRAAILARLCALTETNVRQIKHRARRKAARLAIPRQLVETESSAEFQELLLQAARDRLPIGTNRPLSFTVSHYDPAEALRHFRMPAPAVPDQPLASYRVEQLLGAIARLGRGRPLAEVAQALKWPTADVESIQQALTQLYTLRTRRGTPHFVRIRSAARLNDRDRLLVRRMIDLSVDAPACRALAVFARGKHGLRQRAELTGFPDSEVFSAFLRDAGVTAEEVIVSVGAALARHPAFSGSALQQLSRDAPPVRPPAAPNAAVFVFRPRSDEQGSVAKHLRQGLFVALVVTTAMGKVLLA